MKQCLVIISLFFTCIGCRYHPSEPRTDGGIDSGLATDGQLLWKIQRIQLNGIWANGTGSVVEIQPIRFGNKIYVAYDSIVQCLDASSGKTLWISSLGKIADYPFLTAENMFLENGRLTLLAEHVFFCLDAETGELIWKTKSRSTGDNGFADSYYGSSAQSQNAFYATSGDKTGKVYKISKATGAILWESDGSIIHNTLYDEKPDANWNGCPAYSNGRVYVSARYGTTIFGAQGLDHDGSVACFDDATGKLLWCNVMPPMDKKYTPYTPNRDADHATGEYHTNVACANIIAINDTIIVKTGNAMTWMDKDGNILWRCGAPDKHELAETPWQIRYLMNTLLVLDYKNGMPQCYGMDPVTHEVSWETTMSQNKNDYHSYILTHTTASVGSVIYFLSDDYWIIGIDAFTGQRTYAISISRLLYDKDNSNQVWHGAFLVDDQHRFYIMDNQYFYCVQMNQ